jgi:hypothetical protein
VTAVDDRTWMLRAARGEIDTDAAFDTVRAMRLGTGLAERDPELAAALASGDARFPDDARRWPAEDRPSWQPDIDVDPATMDAFERYRPMTAGNQENAAAAAAQTAGEAAAAKHDSDALTQHAISGSATAIEPALTPDQHAIEWTEPHGFVLGATPDNAGENRSPNVDRPLDNSQSQP